MVICRCSRGMVDLNLWIWGMGIKVKVNILSMVQVVKMGWAIIIIRVKMDRICSNNIMGVVSNSNSTRTRTRAKITTLIHKSKQTVVSIKVIIVLILIIIIIINRKNHTKKRVIKETMTRKKS